MYTCLSKAELNSLPLWDSKTALLNSLIYSREFIQEEGIQIYGFGIVVNERYVPEFTWEFSVIVEKSEENKKNWFI